MTGFSLNQTLTQAADAFQAGNLTEAADLYQAALRHEPEHPDARLGAGLVALEIGDADGACDHLRTAATADPKRPEIHLALAEACTRTGQTEDAIAALTSACSLDPDNVQAWRRKGGLERLTKQLDEALKSLETAHALAPRNPAVMNDLAVVKRARRDFKGAEALYHQAIALAPDQAVLHANLGNLLETIGRTADAEAALRRAYMLDPDGGDIRTNLAALLTKLHRPAEALPLLETAVARHPERWDILTNLGIARLNTGDTEGAEHALRRAIVLKDHNPEAWFNLAWVLLLTGRYDEGWPAFEWRWRMEGFTSAKHAFEIPKWNGMDSPVTLLIHAEQGLGDAIQFVRFARQARTKAGTTIVEVPAPLVRLFKTIDGIGEVVETGQSVPSATHHIPMLSLPAALKTTIGTIPDHDAYIPMPEPVPAALALPKTDGLKVGFVWAGSADNKMDAIRSLTAEVLMPLMTMPGVYPVTLQVGPGADQWSGTKAAGIGFDAAHRVSDFLDTAAVISQLDLVIGVDTAVLHLAAAMGKPAWWLLAHMPDYRWMLNRPDSPWYRAARLFRQPAPGDWDRVLKETRGALRYFIEEKLERR